MIEATTLPVLRKAAHEAHAQRSLAAWRMIGAIRALSIRCLAQQAKRAAPQDGPSDPLKCTA